MSDENQQLHTRVTQLQKENKAQAERIDRLENQFAFFSDFVSAINTMQSSEDVYAFLAEKIRTLNPRSYIVVSGKQEDTGLLGLKVHLGFSQVFEKMGKILGKNPRNIQVSPKDMTAEEQQKYTSGRFEKLSDGLYKLGARKISRGVCEAIEKLLQIEAVYSMGFSLQNQPQGGVILLLKKGENLHAKELMETMIKHTAIALEELNAKSLLHKNQQRYKQAERVAHLGSWELDVASEMSYWSDEFFRICGYEPGAFQPDKEKVFAIFHPDDRWEVRQEFEQTLATGKPMQIVKRVLRPDHTLRWVKVVGELDYNEQGQPQTLTGSLLDITGQQKLEQQLQQENERLGTILSNIQVGLIIHNPGPKVEWVNEHIRRLFPQGEPEGTICYEFFEQRDAPCPDCAVKKAFETGEEHTAESYNRASDRWFLSTAQPLLKRDGETRQVLEAVMEITDFRRNEQALKEARDRAEINEQKYRMIFEGAPLGIFRSTKTGRFIEVNQALANMLGYTTPEEVVREVDDIARQIYVDTSKRAEIVDNTTREKTLKFENTYRRRNGEIFYANLYLRTISDPEKGEILEGIVEETTERRRYIEALKEAKERAEESDRLKSAFLANMSHEIRTPLNGIVGFSQILMKTGYTDKQKQFFTRTIVDNSHRLLQVINDILDLSMLESQEVQLQPGMVVVNEMIAAHYDKFQSKLNAKNLAFTTEMPLSDAKSTIITDKYRLNQVLTILLDNAFKFTSEGAVTVGYELQGGRMRFFVKDTGVGIAKAYQQKIFERFTQEEMELARQYGGTGLGLAIAQKLVELLGGSITVESEKGEGAAFYFALPYKPSQHN